MREIGIVRRVDELGRIVIPKSIRSKFKIRQGDVFEIFVDENRIVLQKEEILENLNDSLNKLLDIISVVMNIEIVVTDTGKCIYTSSDLSEYLNRELSSDIVDMIFKRKEVEVVDYLFYNQKCNLLMQPIILRGDIIGSVIFLIKKGNISDYHKLICTFVNEMFINTLDV